jgi:hypothetical protein
MRMLAGAAAVALLGIAAGCDRDPPRPPRSEEALAVEAKAGDFADYWAEVLRLSRRYATRPDSFAAAVDALPGSHLTEAEWDAWTAPYRQDSRLLAKKLEGALSEMPPARAEAGSRTP